MTWPQKWWFKKGPGYPRKCKPRKSHPRRRKLADGLFRKDRHSGFRFYVCPTCGTESAEGIDGVPLRCQYCGKSFLLHPGLPPTRPAGFDPFGLEGNNPFADEPRRFLAVEMFPL